MNGTVPIMGMSTMLFVIGGYIFSIRTSQSSARIHRFIQIWVVNGIILPFIVLAIGIPFLAFFLFGGILAYWSIFVLICMLGAMSVDRRIAKEDPEPSCTTYFHKVSLVLFGTGVGATISAIIIRIV